MILTATVKPKERANSKASEIVAETHAFAILLQAFRVDGFQAEEMLFQPEFFRILKTSLLRNRTSPRVSK